MDGLAVKSTVGSLGGGGGGVNVSNEAQTGVMLFELESGYALWNAVTEAIF